MANNNKNKTTLAEGSAEAAAEDSKKFELPSGTKLCDGKYKLTRKQHIKISTGIGNFDLENLTVEQAEKLVNIGCTWLTKVGKDEE